MNSLSPHDLQKHMAGTYFGLRVGLVVVGFTLPFLLWIGAGLLYGLPLQGSMSAYYNAPPAPGPLAPRDVFVGGLFVTAACLYLYKGFTVRENVALNLAGVFVALVALFPTAPTGVRTGPVTLHGTFAVLFFACIAYVSLRRATDTLELVEPEDRDRYRYLYKGLGTLMVVSPLGAAVVAELADQRRVERTYVFWAEAFAGWVFSAYWAVKTAEMRASCAVVDALDAELLGRHDGVVERVAA